MTARTTAPRRPAVILPQRGEGAIWLLGGALLLCLGMIAGLLILLVRQGGGTFWQGPVVRWELVDGRHVQGEVVDHERYRPDPQWLADLEPRARQRVQAARDAEGRLGRQLLRSANHDLTGHHSEWIDDHDVVGRSRPVDVALFERTRWGRLYGTPLAFLADGRELTRDPARIWELFEEHHAACRELRQQQQALEDGALKRVTAALHEARLQRRMAVLRDGQVPDELERRSAAQLERGAAEHRELTERLAALRAEGARHALLIAVTGDHAPVELPVDQVVRAVRPNRLDTGGRLGLYVARWWAFLWEPPREGNTEGGVYPALFGTVLMTLIMTLLVVPLGVLAALYLREYAHQGPLVSAVRIAVNNLAGVPSIVVGVFGLGFFCYGVGGFLDDNVLRYAADQPNPTFAKGGLLWAAFTLALLTLPVVIIATEESLAAVPRSMREGSYACGATRWQTLQRIVLPRAAPGIMTGMILAVARAAGEVAPLMLVGAVKLADELPVDWNDMGGSLGPLPTGPLHLERSFMHLGYHIFDLGFHSPNSEAAKPMVYTTTLLLIGLVLILNLLAVTARSRLRRRLEGAPR